MTCHHSKKIVLKTFYKYRFQEKSAILVCVWIKLEKKHMGMLAELCILYT